MRDITRSSDVADARLFGRELSPADDSYAGAGNAPGIFDQAGGDGMATPALAATDWNALRRIRRRGRTIRVRG